LTSSVSVAVPLKEGVVSPVGEETELRVTVGGCVSTRKLTEPLELLSPVSV